MMNKNFFISELKVILVKWLEMISKCIKDLILSKELHHTTFKLYLHHKHLLARHQPNLISGIYFDILLLGAKKTNRYINIFTAKVSLEMKKDLYVTQLAEKLYFI